MGSEEGLPIILCFQLKVIELVKVLPKPFMHHTKVMYIHSFSFLHTTHIPYYKKFSDHSGYS